MWEFCDASALSSSTFKATAPWCECRLYRVCALSVEHTIIPFSSVQLEQHSHNEHLAYLWQRNSLLSKSSSRWALICRNLNDFCIPRQQVYKKWVCCSLLFISSVFGKWRVLLRLICLSFQTFGSKSTRHVEILLIQLQKDNDTFSWDSEMGLVEYVNLE